MPPKLGKALEAMHSLYRFYTNAPLTCVCTHTYLLFLYVSGCVCQLVYSRISLAMGFAIYVCTCSHMFVHRCIYIYTHTRIFMYSHLNFLFVLTALHQHLLIYMCIQNKVLYAHQYSHIELYICIQNSHSDIFVYTYISGLVFEN